LLLAAARAAGEAEDAYRLLPPEQCALAVVVASPPSGGGDLLLRLVYEAARLLALPSFVDGGFWNMPRAQLASASAFAAYREVQLGLWGSRVVPESVVLWQTHLYDPALLSACGGRLAVLLTHPSSVEVMALGSAAEGAFDTSAEGLAGFLSWTTAAWLQWKASAALDLSTHDAADYPARSLLQVAALLSARLGASHELVTGSEAEARLRAAPPPAPTAGAEEARRMRANLRLLWLSRFRKEPRLAAWGWTRKRRGAEGEAEEEEPPPPPPPPPRARPPPQQLPPQQPPPP